MTIRCRFVLTLQSSLERRQNNADHPKGIRDSTFDANRIVARPSRPRGANGLAQCHATAGPTQRFGSAAECVDLAAGKKPREWAIGGAKSPKTMKTSSSKIQCP